MTSQIKTTARLLFWVRDGAIASPYGTACAVVEHDNSTIKVTATDAETGQRLDLYLAPGDAKEMADALIKAFDDISAADAARARQFSNLGRDT